MSQTRAQLISDLVQALNFAGTSDAPATGLFCGAADEVALATNSTARLTVDGSGRVLIGTSTAQTFPTESAFQLAGNSFATSSIRQTRFESGSSGPSIIFAHARGTEASPTILSNGDELGKIRFYAHDGTDFASNGAEIRADVDGTPGENDTPARLVFSTTADGANTFTERMRIDSSGDVGVGTSSPTSRLHVDDAVSTITLESDASNDVQVRFQQGSTFVGAVGYDHSEGCVYLNRFGNATQGLVVDNSGNVGIGTTSPAQLLHIEGSNGGANIRVQSRAFFGGQFSNHFAVIGSAVRVDTGETTGMVSTETSSGNGRPSAIRFGAGEIEFHSAASSTAGAAFDSERVRIDSSGRVGIATTSPNFTLDANGEVGITEGQRLSWHDGSGGRSASIFGGSGDVLVFANTSSNTERMRIDSSGRVLIGTTTEGSGNADNLTIADSGHSGITIRSGTSSNGSIYFSDATSGGGEYDGYVEYEHDNQRLNLGTAGNTRLRIDSSGQLLINAGSAFGTDNELLQISRSGGGALAFARDDTSIGTGNVMGLISWYGNDSDGTFDQIGSIRLIASANHSNTSKPTTLIFATTQVDGTSTTDRFRIDNIGRIDHFSSDGNGYDLHHAETGGSDVAFQLKNGATGLEDGTNVMQILADGDVENANGRYTQISDIKFKENIVDASSQWEDLKAIRVVNFNFKAEKNWGTHRQIGVIAQEIETVSPGLICQRREENGEEYKSVAYSVLHMKAVKALQEAMDRIETLEAKVAALEAE
jgi:hypothetical protein|tara:strand:- start:131 stop:2425 length:2295 start_codon:yes stop_codon:yes gene_type:complete